VRDRTEGRLVAADLTRHALGLPTTIATDEGPSVPASHLPDLNQLQTETIIELLIAIRLLIRTDLSQVADERRLVEMLWDTVEREALDVELEAAAP
jgi:hypothetical protein